LCPTGISLKKVEQKEAADQSTAAGKQAANHEGYAEEQCCGSGIRIRIHRIHMFLGLQDPDPLVRGMDPDPEPALDPDPSIITLK
jgi:hypothetical protein